MKTKLSIGQLQRAGKVWAGIDWIVMITSELYSWTKQGKLYRQGPLEAQGLIEPDEGIAIGNTKIEWYSVKDASICITIHIEAFFIH